MGHMAILGAMRSFQGPQNFLSLRCSYKLNIFIFRAKNVLLANVPESEAGQGEERKKDDENMVNALFTNALKIDANDTRGKIVSVGRLGKKRG